jgi:hypothetical protein
MAEKWFNILMTADAKGAVLGIYSMDFENGKEYKVDEALKDYFIAMDVCAISGAPTPESVRVLHFDKFGNPFWGYPIAH